jgi:hypothetical protein
MKSEELRLTAAEAHPPGSKGRRDPPSLQINIAKTSPAHSAIHSEG